MVILAIGNHAETDTSKPKTAFDYYRLRMVAMFGSSCIFNIMPCIILFFVPFDTKVVSLTEEIDHRSGFMYRS